MTKEVLIHLKGMQTTDETHGPDEPLELITTGEYYYRNDTHYLLYDEQMEGLDEPVHNMVKIRPGHMEVRKKGPVQTNMVFEEEKQNLTCYQTPYGPAPVPEVPYRSGKKQKNTYRKKKSHTTPI